MRNWARGAVLPFIVNRIIWGWNLLLRMYISEQVSVNLQNGSDTSSSSSSEQEEGEEELSEEDGEGFSGREALQNVHQPLDLV